MTSCAFFVENVSTEYIFVIWRTRIEYDYDYEITYMYLLNEAKLNMPCLQ